MHQNKLEILSGGTAFNFDEIDKLEVLNVNGNNIKALLNNEVINGNVELVSKSRNKYKVLIEGEFFEVTIKTEVEQTVEKMGLNKPKLTKIKEIKAPMPGLVLDINVSVGQEIEMGQKLLILEAMKMENVLKLPHTGVIKKIFVKKGDAVEKGQKLLELE